jgi:hypothetical protein
MPGLHMLLKVLATLPVSTATPDRIFFKVESTLATRRSTMSEERFEALILLQALRDRVANMSTKDIQWRPTLWQSSANALPVCLNELLVALPVFFRNLQIIADIDVILYFVPELLILPIYDAGLQTRCLILCSGAATENIITKFAASGVRRLDFALPL